MSVSRSPRWWHLTDPEESKFFIPVKLSLSLEYPYCNFECLSDTEILTDEIPCLEFVLK